MTTFAPAIINKERQVALLVGALPFTPLSFSLKGETVICMDSGRNTQSYRIGEKTRRILSGAPALKLFETDEEGNPVKLHHLCRSKEEAH